MLSSRYRRPFLAIWAGVSTFTKEIFSLTVRLATQFLLMPTAMR